MASLSWKDAAAVRRERSRRTRMTRKAINRRKLVDARLSAAVTDADRVRAVVLHLRAVLADAPPQVVDTTIAGLVDLLDDADRASIDEHPILEGVAA